MSLEQQLIERLQQLSPSHLEVVTESLLSFSGHVRNLGWKYLALAILRVEKHVY